MPTGIIQNTKISRLRLNTTAFSSRHLGRHTRRTATSPIFDKLPLEDEYKAAQQKLRNARGPKDNSPPRADCYLQDHP